MIGYKLFNVKNGKLYALYVYTNEEIPQGIWLEAKNGPLIEKSNGSVKVKSKLGELAYRPGWHSSFFPVARHIGEKENPHDSFPSYRPSHQVWAEVEISDKINYQELADKQGKSRSKKFLKFIPKDGFYLYKTNPNMIGEWIISGAIEINRILSDEEVYQINSQTGVHDLPRRK